MSEYLKLAKALRACASPNGCRACPYASIGADCGVRVSLNAAAAIEELVSREVLSGRASD